MSWETEPYFPNSGSRNRMNYNVGQGIEHFPGDTDHPTRNKPTHQRCDSSDAANNRIHPLYLETESTERLGSCKNKVCSH